MNKKFNFDQSTIRILYYRNKEYIIPSAIILICLILFIKFIIPQGQELFLIKEKEKETQTRVENLKKNLNFLSSVDSSDLDSKLEIASNPFPPIEIDDYALPGNLSAKETKLINEMSSWE